MADSRLPHFFYGIYLIVVGGSPGRERERRQVGPEVGQLQPVIAVFPRNTWANLYLLGRPNTLPGRGASCCSTGSRGTRPRRPHCCRASARPASRSPRSTEPAPAPPRRPLELGWAGAGFRWTAWASVAQRPPSAALHGMWSTWAGISPAPRPPAACCSRERVHARMPVEEVACDSSQ